jgi:hypothetical protein
MAATFKDVYRMLEIKGPGKATSSRGTEYRIEARSGNIVAFPRFGPGDRSSRLLASGRDMSRDSGRRFIQWPLQHLGLVRGSRKMIVDRSVFTGLALWPISKLPRTGNDHYRAL